MALKNLIQFPISAPPPNPTHDHHHRPPTEIRFSRWNNANAEKFNRHERTQKQIEDQLRLLKRFDSAHKIANIHENTPTNTTTAAAANETFKSIGTPSAPSSPSIPGKKSKYSQNSPRNTHPAFRRMKHAVIRNPAEAETRPQTAVKVTDDGVSYILPNAPFAFQYSYTETPKAKPIKLREPPVAPFGPTTMPRPWTGRKPLPSGKKVEFDSFRLPPPGKKGVKPVQAPGPFLPGSGPKYVRSREEVLGEPLTKEEIDEMVMGCRKTKRQLNMGRDGLTHNMLDNIHDLWKRKRVCKIKCKGVCTVDMDNVRQQLEEKTGGKIIYSRGGIIYLFRGRNYNHKTRPHFPLMLWKPVTPVYPRLIQRVPEGLTLEEASEMRKKGRKLTPICKLGKNGVYTDLVKNVREAFEACELVRINCQGMKGSDYHKIGAKLKDLVPCVLISFEREHILMWRGRDWKSSLSKLRDDSEDKNLDVDGVISIPPHLDGQVVTASSIPKPDGLTSLQTLSSNPSLICSEDAEVAGGEVASIEVEDHLPEVNDELSLVCGSVSNATDVCGNTESDGKISIAPQLEGEAVTVSSVSTSVGFTRLETHGSSIEAEDHLSLVNDTLSLVSSSVLNKKNIGSEAPSTIAGCGADDSELLTESNGISHTTESDEDAAIMSVGYNISLGSISRTENQPNPLSVVLPTFNELQDSSETLQNLNDRTRLSLPWTEGVLVLWKEAIDGGTAVVLDDSSLDADIVYTRAVALAKSAPPGPVFRHRRKKFVVQKREELKTEDSEVKEVVIVSEKGGSERKKSTNRVMKDIKEEYLNMVPQGSLRVDELAKLLA